MSITAKQPQPAAEPATSEEREEETAEERRRRQIELNQPIIALLESWLEGDDDDEREQRETLALLMQGIDEVRPPGAKLFVGLTPSS